MDFCEFFSHSSYEVVTDHDSLTDLAPQVFLLLQLAPPVLGALTVWRLMERPGSVIWTVIVLHSNIILWSGIHITCHLSCLLSVQQVFSSRSSALIMLSTHSCRGAGVARSEERGYKTQDMILYLF